MNIPLYTAITNGIKISVSVAYQPAYSKPLHQEFIYAYRVSIENQSNQTVQLLRRHWHIWDSNGIWREVEGEGVVGEQPVLAPYQSHAYVSGSSLGSEWGKMFGTFQFQTLPDHQIMEVQIPEFQLIALHKWN
jgi:ApaG protein